MAKVIDMEPRRIRHEHDRKDARAKALQDNFRKVREEQQKQPENQSHATGKLLAIFKSKSPQKPPAPKGRK